MSRDPKKMQRLRKVVLDCELAGARAVRGLFKDPADPEYNPDATSTWKECSMRTRAALVLTGNTMAGERAKSQAPVTNNFGVVWMPAQIRDAGEWERQAAAMNGRVIDAVSREIVQQPAGVGGVPAQLRPHLREVHEDGPVTTALAKEADRGR